MKKLIFVTATFLFSLLYFHADAQKIGTFGSSVTESAGPVTIRIPYHDVISYLGYAAEGTEDETRDGKKFYYLYVWIPAYAPELGVRMMSPAAKEGVKEPIIVSEAYKEHEDSKDFFDTYITLERSDIFNPEDVTEENVNGANWIILDSNDDSREMPKQPNRKKYNSLLRYGNLTGSSEALIVGLYRIGFTSYKKGDVKGTFLAQIGSPVKLDGVAIAKTIEELRKQMNLPEEEKK